MVNLKLAFTDWFFLLRDYTNEVMQNPIAKLRHRSIISEKPGYLPEKLTSSNYTRHVSYLTMSTKECARFFKTLFRSWVINKNVKKSVKKPGPFNFCN